MLGVEKSEELRKSKKFPRWGKKYFLPKNSIEHLRILWSKVLMGMDGVGDIYADSRTEGPYSATLGDCTWEETCF